MFLAHLPIFLKDDISTDPKSSFTKMTIIYMFQHDPSWKRKKKFCQFLWHTWRSHDCYVKRFIKWGVYALPPFSLLREGTEIIFNFPFVISFCPTQDKYGWRNDLTIEDVFLTVNMPERYPDSLGKFFWDLPLAPFHRSLKAWLPYHSTLQLQPPPKEQLVQFQSPLGSPMSLWTILLDSYFCYNLPPSGSDKG